MQLLTVVQGEYARIRMLAGAADLPRRFASIPGCPKIAGSLQARLPIHLSGAGAPGIAPLSHRLKYDYPS